MAYSLSPWLKPRFFITGTNRPLAGGLMYTYKAGTTDPAKTYSDDSGTENTNPIVLDSDGQCDLFLDDAVSYRIILKNSAGVTQFDKDRIASLGSTQVQSFNSIAALRLRSGTTIANAAKTLGYYAAGDGGGNSFYWDGTSTATDNAGTVIKPTSVIGAGRWLAVNKFELNVQQFGARGDGVNNDYAAITNCLAAGGAGSTVIFPYTGAAYLISQGLKFYAGQKLIGGGGVDIITTATQIKLTAISTSVLESITPASANFGSEIKGLYLNGQGFCDAVLNLYNCNRSNVEDVACNTTKAGSCGILFDSNVSLFCYANQVKNPRIYATGVGSVGMRFTRGANINQIWGGSVVSSTRGMEFLSLSSGNLVVGTDFEYNVTDHIYVDAPNNIFIGTHMENCPIGFNITVLGTNTQRMNTSYSTSTVINVQDASTIGTVLDTRLESGGTYGDLRFGGSKYKTTLNSVITSEDHDLTPATGSSNVVFRWFLNTVTTGTRKHLFYKGDGTNTVTASIDAATGEYQCSDLIQENGQGNGVYRKTIRRAVAPTTGTWTRGDICNFTSPVSGGYIGAVCTVSGTPGTWTNYGLIA